MVNEERIAHRYSWSCTGGALLHQQRCLIMSPTKVEPHPSDPDYDKLHSAVPNLLTTLVWKLSLLICLVLVLSKCKMTWWDQPCYALQVVFFGPQHSHSPTTCDCLREATPCVQANGRGVESPLGMMVLFVIHQPAKKVSDAVGKRCPQPPSYCHPDSFNYAVTCHPNPILHFPSRSCPWCHAHPCYPHFAPAVYISTLPPASILLCFFQPGSLPASEGSPTWSLLLAWAAGRPRPFSVSTAACGTPLSLLGPLSRPQLADGPAGGGDGAGKRTGAGLGGASGRGRSRVRYAVAAAVARRRALCGAPSHPGPARPAGRSRPAPAASSRARGEGSCFSSAGARGWGGWQPGGGFVCVAGVGTGVRSGFPFVTQYLHAYV